MNTILQKKNIILNCQPKPKEEIIKEIGKIFYDDGYTTEKYTQAMLDKEKVFNTVIGIAGAGDEHIDILSNIAVTCSDEDEVDEILKSSADDIYNTFANVEA